MTTFFNRIKFSVSSNGTNDFQVNSAIVGFRTPAAAAVPDGSPVSYTAFSSDMTQWETGHGTYHTAGTTVSRDTPLDTSAGFGIKVNFTLQPTVQLDYLAQDTTLARPQRSITSGPVTISTTDQVLNINSVNDLVITVPAAATRNGVPLTFKNLPASHSQTLNRTGGDTFDGATSLQLYSDAAITLVPYNDGVNTGYAVWGTVPSPISFNLKDFLPSNYVPGTTDVRPYWDAAVTAAAGSTLHVTGAHTFNTAPATTLGNISIVGDGIDATSITRNYTPGVVTDGFLTISSFSVNIKDLTILAGAGTTDGYAIKDVWANNNSGGGDFILIENVDITGSNVGTFRRGLNFDGTLRNIGVRDLQCNRVIIFNCTEASIYGKNVVNLNVLGGSLQQGSTPAASLANFYVTGDGVFNSNYVQLIMGSSVDVHIDNTNFATALVSSAGLITVGSNVSGALTFASHGAVSNSSPNSCQIADIGSFYSGMTFDSKTSGNRGTTPFGNNSIGLYVIGPDGGNFGLAFDAFASNSSIVMRRADGTNAAPTKILLNDVLGSWAVRGYSTTYSNNQAVIRAFAGENWNDTAHLGCGWDVLTTPTATSTAVQAVRYWPSGGMSVGSAPSDPNIGCIDVATGYRINASAALNTFLGGDGTNYSSRTVAQVKTSLEQGMTLLNVITGNNVASIQDTTSFSATYDDYLITVDNAVPVTNAAVLQMQLQFGGTFQSTGYINNSALTTAIDMSSNTGISNSAGVGDCSQTYIMNINNSSMTKFVHGRGCAWTGTVITPHNIAGFWNNTGNPTGFLIQFSSGNISTVTVKVYGLRNAL